MRAPRRAFSGFSTAFLVASFAAACSSAGDDAVHVGIAPSLVFPRGLLDNVGAVNLTVYAQANGVDCDASSGTLTGVSASTPKVASAQLGTSGCVGTAKYCGSVSVQKDTTVPRIFAAQALDPSNNVVANGCTVATVDQDTMQLAIKMVRFVPPSVCGDGKVDPLEQCDEPTTDVCDHCHSIEESLTNAVTATNPFFLWREQSGDAGRFFGFFTETLAGPHVQIAMRLMTDSLARVAAPSAAATGPLIVPNNPSTFPPQPAANDQSFPAAAIVGGVTYVVFRDTDSGSPDIHLRSFDASLTALQAAAVGINGPNGAGENGVHTAPVVAAGPGGVLFVAWQSDSGSVFGRTFTPAPGGTGSLGTQNQISSGAQNKNVRIAATSTGWLAVWESGSDVKIRAIDASGTPSGSEDTVNDPKLHHGVQDHPDIAVLSDGRGCVTWADHGAPGGTDIFVQRYTTATTKVPGDQTTRINDGILGDTKQGGDGEQITPVIAGTTNASASSGAFAVAWLDSVDTHVHARLLGANSGFLFNNVDAQSTEFQASVTPNVPSRTSPVIAIGGVGPFIAIGWQDASGIHARRFPVPTQ